MIRGVTTTLGIFEVSNLEHLEEVFSKHLKGKRFLDLGSGIGQVVKLAFVYARTATGIEYEKPFIDCTHIRENILHKDFFEHDFSQYDVLYYYVSGTKDERRLVEKIANEFTGIFIVYHAELPSDDRDFYNLNDFELLEEFPHGKVYVVRP